MTSNNTRVSDHNPEVKSMQMDSDTGMEPSQSLCSLKS